MSRAVNRLFKRNVGPAERMTSALLAGMLLRFGVTRVKSLSGALALVGGSGLLFRAATGFCPAYDALGIDTTPLGRDAKRGLLDNRSLNVSHSVAIARPLKDVYRFCLTPSNFFHFGDLIGSLHKTGDGHAHWILRGPGGLQLSFNLELSEERENDRLRWRTLPGAPVHHSGSVRFRERGDSETEVRLSLDYSPPGGVFGSAATQALTPLVRMQVAAALKRMKEVLEAKETTVPPRRRANGTSMPVAESPLLTGRPPMPMPAEPGYDEEDVELDVEPAKKSTERRLDS